VSLATLVSCGSGSSSQNINGSWFGVFAANPNSSLAFTLGANLAQGSGNNVTVSNVSFGSSLACFSSGFSATATFSPAGSSNGFQTGSFSMKVSEGNNVLMIDGARNSDGSISGAWILTGQTGCNGNGLVKMSLPHADPP
jgi:hypothetical protein